MKGIATALVNDLVATTVARPFLVVKAELVSQLFETIFL
jgi:hypothetical protein